MVPSHQFGLVIRSTGCPILLVSLRKWLERRVMKLTNLMSQSVLIVATIPPFVVACWMNGTLLIWVSKTEIVIAGMHSLIITIHSLICHGQLRRKEYLICSEFGRIQWMSRSMSMAMEVRNIQFNSMVEVWSIHCLEACLKSSWSASSSFEGRRVGTCILEHGFAMFAVVPPHLSPLVKVQHNDAHRFRDVIIGDLSPVLKTQQRKLQVWDI